LREQTKTLLTVRDKLAEYVADDDAIIFYRAKELVSLINRSLTALSAAGGRG
jgi:hypothetical protein